ncbi:MAG: hypothetical protein ACLP1X_09315 [Polyangiaceae bacterium]
MALRKRPSAHSAERKNLRPSAHPVAQADYGTVNQQMPFDHIVVVI